METSIKLVTGGSDLALKVKRILLMARRWILPQIQSVCTEIGKRYKIPAVPFIKNNKQEILIPASHSPSRQNHTH